MKKLNEMDSFLTIERARLNYLRGGATGGTGGEEEDPFRESKDPKTKGRSKSHRFY